MRVTNKMLSDNYLYDMQTNLQNMKTIQKQLSSGKEVSKPSDDPFKVARTMQLNTDIDSNTQYNKNILNASNWLDTTDSSLSQVGEVLQRINEELVSAGNAAYGSSQRSAIKDEINQRVGQLSQILNTTFDGKYIFGGTRGTDKPTGTTVDVNGNNTIDYSDSTEPALSQIKSSLNVEISQGVKAKYNVTASDIFSYKDGASTLAAPTNLQDLLKNIVNHLDGRNADGTIPSSATVTESAGNTLTITDPSGTHDITVTLSQNSSDSLNVTSPDATHINIALANTTPGNNTIAKIQAAVQSLPGFNNFTVSGSTTWDTTATGSTITTATVTSLKAPVDPVKALITGDLQGIKDATNNLLKIRAQVGAMQNRMDSAKDENVQEKYSMTEILSKTEDVDYAEKIMDFSTLQTVYLASLQTSSKIIQPSLLDYMS